MKTKCTVLDEFSPQLIHTWNSLLAHEGNPHGLGQTPEWCERRVGTDPVDSSMIVSRQKQRVLQSLRVTAMLA
jgi:hypothetical protein